MGQLTDTEVVTVPGASAQPGREEARELAVAGVATIAERVVAIQLVDPTGRALPSWAPGAHIDLLLPDGVERQYSLCGDPADGSSWTIAVLRELDGRGGSQWIHESLEAGDRIGVRGPRNRFALVEAPEHLFIAGGIGITPLLPMIAELERDGRPWRLHYGGRTRAAMAFADQVVGYGAAATLCPQEEQGLLDVDEIVGAAAPGTAIYCCGPEALIAVVEERCATLSSCRLHVERFQAKAVERPTDHRFEVVAAQSGVSVMVEPGQSIVDALESVGVYIPTSCGEGTCGTCESGLLEGVPQHRDSVLSAEEQAENSMLMPCCSRAATSCGRLVLDL